MEKFKLGKKVKEVWVKALRSGRYVQFAGGTLWNGSTGVDAKYCCLGVARAKRLCKGTTRPLPNNCNLPMEQLRYAHQRFVSCAFLPAYIQLQLASKNDRGYSFVQIADWIEKNL